MLIPMSKYEMFNLIKQMIQVPDFKMPRECSLEDVIDFLNHEQELLDKRAARSKVAAEKRKAANNEITDLVEAALEDEWMTIEDLVEKISRDDVTRNKVIYHVNKLAKAGMADKAEVMVELGEGKNGTKVAFRKHIDE